MKIKFNTAQLGRVRHDSLARVLNVLESENEGEIEVSAFEFPEKLKVKVDKGVMVLVWDTEKESYSGLTEPESTELESSPEIKDHIRNVAETSQASEPEKLGVGAMMESPELITFGYMDMAGKFTPASEEHTDIDPMRLARLKYELMVTHLNMPDEKKIIFAKEYARLWSEHR